MINVNLKTWAAKPDLRLGLVGMLTTSIVMVIVLVMVLTTLLDIRRSRDVFRADLAERGLLLAQTLNEVMAQLVYFADVDDPDGLGGLGGLDSLTERVSRSQPDLTHVQVYTPTGRILAYYRAPRHLEDAEIPEPRLVLPSDDLPTAIFGDNGLEIFSALKLGPRTVGVVNLGFDETSLHDAIRIMVIQHIWQGAFLVAMGVLLAYLIAHHATKPLKDLAAAALEFGQGNLDTPTPIQGTKEVSLLGGALEVMRLELRGQYHGLEGQVAQRTRQLSIANEELKKESAERKNTEEQLAGLFEVSGAMGQPGSFKEKAEAVMKKVAQIAQADWVVMRVPSEEGLKLVALEGEMAQDLRPWQLTSGQGTVSSEAFRSGKFMVTNDYPSHPNATANSIELGIKSMISLPLKASGTPVGLMNVLSTESGHFTPERVNLLVAIADGLGVLMENANLYDQLVSELTQRKQTQDELAALFEVSGAMGQPGSFEEKAKAVLKKVAHIVQAEWVTMRVPSEQGLKLVAMEGEPGQDANINEFVTATSSMSAEAFRTGEFIVRNDYASHENATANSVKLGIGSMVSLPLKASGTPVGLMNVLSNESGHFTPERVNLLVAIADGLGVLMENANLYDQLVSELTQRQQTQADLGALFEVAGALGQPGSFKEKAQVILRKVAQIAQAEWVTLRVPEDDGMRVVAMETPRADMSVPVLQMTNKETLAHSIFKAGEFRVLDDYPRHPMASQAIVECGIQSVVFVILKFQGKPVGMMSAVSRNLGHFTPERVNLLVAIADGLGVLMENANLYDQLVSELAQHKQTQADLGALFEVAGALGQPRSFEEKAKVVLQQVAQIAQADWVTMRVPEEDGLHVVAVEGPAAKISPPVPALTSKESLATSVFESGDHMVVNDYPAHPRASAAIIEVGMKSMVLMALKYQGKPVGLMNVISRDLGHFTPERVSLLVAIADGLGVMLENARLYEQLVEELVQREMVEEALRESEGNLQALVNSAVAGIVTMDEKGIVESFNPAAERLFGYSADEVIGCPVYKLMPLPHRERHGEYVKRYLATGESNILGDIRELLAQRKDGTIFSMELAISEVDLGDRRTFTGIISDISERKQAEEELSQRALALEAANKELEAFSYSVSHDLRAPLRSIDGFSQALLEDYSELLDEEGKDHLHRVRASSQRMAELIDDMLQLSRVTRTELSRELVDLSATARAIASELQDGEPQRRVTFEIADHLEARGDPRLMGAVLENLFRNAWKFTSGHETAQIKFGITKVDGKSAYFVSDDGAGFDMAYAGKLFGTFQRLHSTEEFEGSGIGLATVQRIIHRHGGRIWAEGQVDKGATFYFTI